jgi:hypothetical protein
MSWLGTLVDIGMSLVIVIINMILTKLSVYMVERVGF